MKRKSKALQQAIVAAGGLMPISKALGVTKQAVSQWHEVPADRVLALEKLSGVSRYDLRPDIFGKAA
jgi:DNA-binding transcriptional regulator YdaS (Cro superfamily)